MAVSSKKKQHFGSFHGIPKLESFLTDEHNLIGGTGFSRLVYCNEPASPEATSLKYGSNYVRTTKYTFATFLPRSLFEQFRRVANTFFLLSAVLSFTPLSPTSTISSVLPFLFVVGMTMVKELIEDLRRKKQVQTVFQLYYWVGFKSS